jgi:hypothetical protein
MAGRKTTGQGAIADRANRIKSLRGIRKDAGGTDALLEERCRECDSEERKAERRGVGRPWQPGGRPDPRPAVARSS